jgi:predicted lipid-binding transport protein (Tim44 family)
MKKFYVLSLLCLASGLVSAQDVIYRCGNEYTNNVSQAKAKGCKPVDGSGVTVIHGTRPSGGNAAAAAAKPKPASSSASSAPAPARSDSAAQKARDSDARAILQGELNKAQARLAELKAEYNDGNPVRTALELRNPQGYPERVAKLKADITRQESDIAGIKRELDRLPAVN